MFELGLFTAKENKFSEVTIHLERPQSAPNNKKQQQQHQPACYQITDQVARNPIPMLGICDQAGISTEHEIYPSYKC